MTSWTGSGPSLVAAPAGAQAPGAFFRLGMGARSVAMPSQVADRSGYASPYLNPALAPFTPAQGVELTAGRLAYERSWEGVQVAGKEPAVARAGAAHGGGRSRVRRSMDVARLAWEAKQPSTRATITLSP